MRLGVGQLGRGVVIGLVSPDLSPGRSGGQRHAILIHADVASIYVGFLPAMMGLAAERLDAGAGRLLSDRRLSEDAPVGWMRVLWRRWRDRLGFCPLSLLFRIVGAGLCCVGAVVTGHRKTPILDLLPARRFFFRPLFRAHQPIQAILGRLLITRFLTVCQVVPFLQSLSSPLLFSTNKKTYLWIPGQRMFFQIGLLLQLDIRHLANGCLMCREIRFSWRILSDAPKLISRACA
jgi:hypothetical protein